MGSLLLLDITAASSGKGDTSRLSSIYFFLPPHHKLSVFLALVISCAHFALGEGVERVPLQVGGLCRTWALPEVSQGCSRASAKAFLPLVLLSPRVPPPCPSLWRAVSPCLWVAWSNVDLWHLWNFPGNSIWTLATAWLFTWSWKIGGVFLSSGHISLCLWSLFTEDSRQLFFREVSLQKWVRTWGKRFHFWLYFWVSLNMLILNLQPLWESSDPIQSWDRGDTPGTRRMGEQLQGQGAQLPAPARVMSQSCLIKIQCVFETIQCWWHSSFSSSFSLSFPIPMSIKLVSIISNVFSAVWVHYSSFYLLHMWWKDAPLPFGNVKIVCIYSYQFLLINLPVLSLFYVPPFIFLCLLKTKILFSW